MGRHIQNDEISTAKPKVDAYLPLGSPTSSLELGKDLGTYSVQLAHRSPALGGYDCSSSARALSFEFRNSSGTSVDSIRCSPAEDNVELDISRPSKHVTTSWIQVRGWKEAYDFDEPKSLEG